MSLEQFMEGYIPDEKYDYINGNPPYDGLAKLHQRVFNRAVELLADGGTIDFIQPATAYFNKKQSTGNANATDLMIENIKRYKTSVVFVSPTIFTHAIIKTDLAITTLTKIESDNENLERVEYINGDVYHDLPIEAVNMTEIAPEVYTSIFKKYFDLIKVNGSMFEIAFNKEAVNPTLEYVKIATQAGSARKQTTHTLPDDYYRLLSAPDHSTPDIIGSEIVHGIRTGNKDENVYIRRYLTTKFARMGASLFKINQAVVNGPLRSIPQVPFNKFHTDEELYALAGFTNEEIEVIETTHPNSDKYYNLK